MGPPLFCFILVPIVLKLRAKYHHHLGVSLKAYMDDISPHFKNITDSGKYSGDTGPRRRTRSSGHHHQQGEELSASSAGQVCPVCDHGLPPMDVLE